MTDVILLGKSRFAQKRVLPALAGRSVRIASKSQPADFDDYARALDAPPALVYVSLVSSLHARWVEAALERGHHVVVDKPAFLDLATAERLVALARARGRVLAEATTWAFHPVAAALRDVGATRATAIFTAPVPETDFRHRREEGGSLADQGPYFASLGRVLWGCPPETLEATGSLTGFSAVATYGEGRTLSAELGFRAPYKNWIELDGAVEASGIFSTPPDVTTMVGTREVPPAFAMQIFLDAVLAAIARGDDAFSETLLADARVRDRLVASVGSAAR